MPGFGRTYGKKKTSAKKKPIRNMPGKKKASYARKKKAK